MNKSIILSVNLYDLNLNTITYGINIAKTLKAPLELFDVQYTAKEVVYDPITGVASGLTEPVYQSQVVENTQEKMNELCAEIKTHWHLTTGKLSKGTLYSGWADKPDHVLDEVEQQKPKMLIITSRNEHNFMNELFGTSETKTAEEADCPVLVVPKDAQYKNLKSIYYLLDREKPMNEVIDEVQYLSELARPFNGNILLVYHSDNQAEIAKKEMAIKKSSIINAVNYDNIGAAFVESFDTKETSDMLVTSEMVSLFAFPKREKSFWERLTDHDNTKHIILKAEIPVLVF